MATPMPQHGWDEDFFRFRLAYYFWSLAAGFSHRSDISQDRNRDKRRDFCYLTLCCLLHEVYSGYMPPSYMLIRYQNVRKTSIAGDAKTGTVVPTVTPGGGVADTGWK